ncbi:TerC family protein [Pandoraea terrigena]|uniref:Membrane protein n=1 Tax=Pandoraea terrigena TaxID=2508292 RepID=A0A5E4TCA1_9BURK|nr:TerC family protein [Pandoraea terrigena]VVD85760.1 membrane protein [Pandoraea terrigena]
MLAFFAELNWAAVLQIIMIDILLGGDNAVVIALACRNLPAKQRLQGVVWGTIGAIVLRVILIAFAVTLLAVPYLKAVGGVLLIWIGIKLLVPDHDAHDSVQPADKLWAAVKTIVIADLVMSIDNVIAIAGAAEGAADHHQLPLVIFGLLVSIPLIVWGSQLVLKALDRFPFIVMAGAALLGWIAGGLIASDPGLGDRLHLPGAAADYTHYVAAAIGMLLVVVVGLVLKRRSEARQMRATSSK